MPVREKKRMRMPFQIEFLLSLFYPVSLLFPDLSLPPDFVADAADAADADAARFGLRGQIGK